MMFGSATKTIKNMLNISNFNETTETGNRPDDLVAHSARDLLCGSPVLDFLKSPKSIENEIDDHSLTEKKNNLCNNCTFDLPQVKCEGIVEINCPKIGTSDASHFINSSFCKVSKLIDYKWENLSDRNIMAIHRSKPIVAYVLNPSYLKAVNMGKIHLKDYLNQKIRLFNYERPAERCLCSTQFTHPIADLSFAYNSVELGQDNKLAAIDEVANVNIFKYSPSAGEIDQELTLSRILIINSNLSNSMPNLKINWCPYVPSDEDEFCTQNFGDIGLMIAVSMDCQLDVFSIDKLKDVNVIDKSELDPLTHNYQHFDGAHKKPIISVSLSNDSTAVCTASLDNSIKFFQVAKPPTSPTLLHQWSPKLAPTDQIIYFHFLDDYNYLLKNRDHNFWGHAFVGTKNGQISIWDLRQWVAIQQIQINCNLEEFDGTCFQYRVDISSHIICAVRGDMALIFFLEFTKSSPQEDDDGSNNEDENNDLFLVPRIIKIARFQLYNHLLSFVIKRKTDTQIDMFWITKNSLERCTIDTQKMDEESQDQKAIGLGITTQRPKVTSITVPSNTSGDLKMRKIKMTNNISRKLQLSKYGDAVLNVSSPLRSLSPRSLNHSTHSTSSESLATAATYENQKIVNQSNRNCSPESTEVEQLMDLEEIKPTNSISPFDLSQSIAVQKPKLVIPQEYIKKYDLERTENRLLEEIKGMEGRIIREIREMRADMVDIRTEMRDIGQIKNDTYNKVINSLVKRTMEQMNGVISQGLGEFMSQVKKETNSAEEQLRKLKHKLAEQTEAQNKLQLNLERQMCQLTKTLEEGLVIKLAK